MLVRTGPHQLMQVTLVERSDGTVDVTQCVEVATNKVPQ